MEASSVITGALKKREEKVEKKNIHKLNVMIAIHIKWCTHIYMYIYAHVRFDWSSPCVYFFCDLFVNRYFVWFLFIVSCLSDNNDNNNNNIVIVLLDYRCECVGESLKRKRDKSFSSKTKFSSIDRSTDGRWEE